jgi:hypothetical protein
VVFRVSECAFHYPPLARAKELVRSRAIRTRRCCGSRRLSARPTRRSDPNCTPTAYGASKLDHAADPRVRKERAAARAVNCETPAAYAVLDQPREATIRPLTGQQEETVQERDPVLTPHRFPGQRKARFSARSTTASTSESGCSGVDERDRRAASRSHAHPSARAVGWMSICRTRREPVTTVEEAPLDITA